MVQHSRVAKVIFCLIAAMIGTTALLDWVDPSLPVETVALGRDQIRQFVRAVVFDEVEVTADRWTGVELRSHPVVESSGVMLMADARPRDWHFRVTKQGRPLRNSLWTRQQPCEDSPGTIAVLIDSYAGGSTVNPLQQLCVTALLATLNHRIRPNLTELPVVRRFD